MIFRYRRSHGEAGADEGSKRDRQQQNLEETARTESWLRMLLRRRRENRGKPKRSAPVNRPWVD